MQTLDEPANTDSAGKRMTAKAINRCHSIEDLRRLARRRLPDPMFHYIDGGADDEKTLGRNRSSFDEYQIEPRFLVDVANVDLRTSVLGSELEWPVFLCPTGVSRLFHGEGEFAAARGAADAGTLYSLSTLSSCDIESVARASAGPKAFQVYVLKDPGLNRDLVERARAAGYRALLLTVDVPTHGNRERDLRTGMTIPPKLSLMSWLDIARHPIWALEKLRQPEVELANIRGWLGQSSSTTLMEYVAQQFNPSVTWDQAEAMIKAWDGPFAIKGLLAPDDARRAADIGATAVIVSNHGGRQLESGISSLDALPAIAEAVGDRVEVLLDGGIRRGTDVLKALALGAKACGIGRAYLYGLGSGGQAGVARALKLLRAEVERGLVLSGCRSLAELDRSFLQRRMQANG